MHGAGDGAAADPVGGPRRLGRLLGAQSRRARRALPRHRSTIIAAPAAATARCPTALDVDDMADDVLALMDGLGLASADIIGHAAGGVDRRWRWRSRRPSGSTGWWSSTAGPSPIRISRAASSAARAAARQRRRAPIVRAQPLFLYPADWISANIDAARGRGGRASSPHFPGARDVREADRRAAAFDIDDAARPRSRRRRLLIAAEDDMLVPDHLLASGWPRRCRTRSSTCMPWGGHACNVTEPDDFQRDRLRLARRRSLRGAESMEVGVFVPISNNGWLI